MMYDHERSLVKRMAGKPFALVGVNTDKTLETYKNAVIKKNLIWRSFYDGPPGGPISKLYKVRGYPTILVLDKNGVVRYRDVKGKALDRAVEKLLEDG